MSTPSEWPIGDVRLLEKRMITTPAAVYMARLLILRQPAPRYHCRICGAERRSPRPDPGYLRSLNPPADCSLAGRQCEKTLTLRAQTHQHYYLPGSLVWYRDALWDRYLPAIVEPCIDGNRSYIRPNLGAASPEESAYFITLIDLEMEEYRGGFVMGNQLTPCYTPMEGAALDDIEDSLDWDLRRRLAEFSFVSISGLEPYPNAVRELVMGREPLPPSPERVREIARVISPDAPAQPEPEPEAVWTSTRVEILSHLAVTQAGIDRLNRRMAQPRRELFFDCALCGTRRRAPFDDPGTFHERPNMACKDAPQSPACTSPPKPRPPSDVEHHFVPGTLVWYLDRRKARWAAMVEDPPDGSSSYIRQEGLPHHRTSYYITLIGPAGMFAGGFAMAKQLRHLSHRLTPANTRPLFEIPTSQALNNLCVDLSTRLQTFSIVVQVLRWRAEHAPFPALNIPQEPVAGPSGLNLRSGNESVSESDEPNQPPQKRQRGAGN